MRPFEHFKEAAMRRCRVDKRVDGGKVDKAGKMVANNAKVLSSGGKCGVGRGSKVGGGRVVAYSSKVTTILEVWEGGMGVVSLATFQNSIAAEALTREACMIEAIGMFSCVCLYSWVC